MLGIPRFVLLTILFLGATNTTLGEDADFQALLARAPDDTNTLVLLNAEKVFASELAVKESWKQQYEKNFAKSPLLLPPAAQQFVLASRLDLRSLTPNWEVAVMRLSTDPSIGLVNRVVKGKQDTIESHEAIATPRGAYLVKLAPAEFGLMSPGDRQLVSRWVREQGENTEPKLSPYLAGAAAFSENVGTEIIMAIDLANALGPATIRSALNGSEVLNEKQIDKDRAATVLSGVQGLTLGVRVTGRAYGSLKVDFDGPIDEIAPVAKPLLLEVLEQAGVSIEEFYDWESQETETGFRISGELSQSGLMRLFSFLELDASVVDGAAEAGRVAASGEGGQQSQADATLEYFHAIEKHLHDLKRERGSAKSYYSIATWFDKYSRRIDRLPTLGVDPELVDFSAYVVSQMRDCSDAIRGVGIRSGARSADAGGGSGGSGYSGYSGGGYGYNSYSNTLFVGSEYAAQTDSVRNVEAQRTTIRREERAKGSTTVRGIIRQLQDDLSGMRRKMTDKYQIEF